MFEPSHKTSNRLLVAQTYPPLNHHVQQLLVTLLFLRGITDEHGVATKQIAPLGAILCEGNWLASATRIQILGGV
jgi:hypothetical protein